MKYACKEMRDKLTRGLKKKYFRKLFRKRDVKKMLWALSLRPGDVFHGCDAWNHRLKEINVEWSNVSGFAQLPHMPHNKNAMFVSCITLIAEDGHLGGVAHCASEKASVEDIHEYFHQWIDNEESREMALQWWPEQTKAIITCFEKNEPICDEDGLKVV